MKQGEKKIIMDKEYSWWDYERAMEETGLPLIQLFDSKTGTLKGKVEKEEEEDGYSTNNEG